MRSKNDQRPNPNLILILKFLRELTKANKPWLPIFTFVLGVLSSFCLVRYSQHIVSQREVETQRKALIARLHGYRPYVMQCWTYYYDLKIDEKYKLDYYRIYNDTLAFFQWRDIQLMESEFIIKTAEARRTLLELLENIEIYFPANDSIHEIINMCNWLPEFDFSSFLELTREQRAMFQDIREWRSAMRDSLGVFMTDYHKPLIELTSLLRREIDNANFAKKIRHQE